MGDTDVIELLMKQHSEIRELFSHVQGSIGAERRDAFRRLVRMLAVHETAEEEAVHPLARLLLPGGDAIISDRLQEEHDAKKLLASLETIDTDDPAFLTSLGELRDAVLAHAESEEQSEFAVLRDELTEAERRGMAAAVKTAQLTAPTHPHPGVESAAMNMVAGPVVAIIDRTRDLVRGAQARFRRRAGH